MISHSFYTKKVLGLGIRRVREMYQKYSIKNDLGDMRMRETTFGKGSSERLLAIERGLAH